MAPTARRPRGELRAAGAVRPGAARGAPWARAQRPCPELLAARLLYLAGRLHEADAALSSLTAEVRSGPEALALTIHVKHALGALTEALDALERRAAGAAGRLGHDPGVVGGPGAAVGQADGDPSGALSMPELLVAATQVFLPLEVLLPLAPGAADPALRVALAGARDTAEALEDHASRDQWSEQLALLAALEGRSEESEAEWRALMTQPTARPLYAKYFASLRAQAGDVEGAVALYAAALAQEPVADPEVLAILLEGEQPEARRLVARILRDPERRQATLQKLQARARREPGLPGPWRLMARFLAAVGDAEGAARFETKAQRLEAHGGERDVGKVKSAAACVVGGVTWGFVHDLWVSRTPASEGGLTVLGNLAPDMVADIHNAFEAARRFVQENFPHLAEEAEGYRYTLKVTKDDRTSDGDSAGAAFTVAFISRFLGLVVPQDVALTGRVVVDSASRLRVAAVGAVDAKALGARQRRLRTLYAPAENEADVPEALRRDVRFVTDIAELVTQLFGDSVWDL